MFLHKICIGLLLVGAVCSAAGENNRRFLRRVTKRVNARDQASLAAVDTGAAANSDHSVVNRAIDGYQYSAPEYLPPLERKLICIGGQVCVKRGVCRGGYFTADLSFARQECDRDAEVCCTYRAPPPPPPPKPTLPASIPCAGRFEACVPPQQCIGGIWQANGLQQPAYASKCYVPDVCCRIPDPDPVSLTDDGYVFNKPQIQFVTPTKRPVKLVTTTRAPVYLPPIRGENQLSLPINPPPKNTIDDPIAMLPVVCPAALNCTTIEYCTFEGYISKTPVSLSPDEQIARVPLTDCQDPVKGYVGKCCRDPDYVDPWPITILGQYVDPQLFGDDGQYRAPSNNLRS